MIDCLLISRVCLLFLLLCFHFLLLTASINRIKRSEGHNWCLVIQLFDNLVEKIEK